MRNFEDQKDNFKNYDIIAGFQTRENYSTVVKITCDESMHHSPRSIHRKIFPDLSDVIQAKNCYIIRARN